MKVILWLFGIGIVCIVVGSFLAGVKSKSDVAKKKTDKAKAKESMEAFADRLMEKLAEKSGKSWSEIAERFDKTNHDFYVGEKSLTLEDVKVSYADDLGTELTDKGCNVRDKMEFIAEHIAKKIPSKTLIVPDSTSKTAGTNEPPSYRTEVSYQKNAYGKTRQIYTTKEIPGKNREWTWLETHGYYIKSDRRITAAPPAEPRKLTQL